MYMGEVGNTIIIIHLLSSLIRHICVLIIPDGMAAVRSIWYGICYVMWYMTWSVLWYLVWYLICDVVYDMERFMVSGMVSDVIWYMTWSVLWYLVL